MSFDKTIKRIEKTAKDAAKGAVADNVGKFIGTTTKIGITTIFFIIIVFQSAIMSIKERSLSPVLENIGIRIIAADYAILKSVDSILSVKLSGDSFVNLLGFLASKLGVLFNLIMSLWFLFIIGSIIYYVVASRDISKKMENVALTLFTLAILQMISSQYFFILEHREKVIEETPLQIAKSFIPFRGVLSFAVNLPKITVRLFSIAETYVPASNMTNSSGV